jgi:4-amino-4-deoxy-L-arabinose transferase-like glycosyltransferase
MQTYKKFVFALFLAVFFAIGVTSVRAATVAGGPAPIVIAQATAPEGAPPAHHHLKRWYALAGVVIIVVVALAIVARRRKPGDAAVKRIG